MHLHRVRHGCPELGEPGQRVELGVRPLHARDGATERRALRDGAHVTGAAQSAALGVDRRAVEVRVLARAVPLGGEQHAVARHVGRGIRDRTLDEVEVRLLAGLHDAELGVDRRGGGDEPVGARLGAALGWDGRRPGRPALALAGLCGLEHEGGCARRRAQRRLHSVQRRRETRGRSRWFSEITEATERAGLDAYRRAASQGRVSAMRTTMTAFIVLSLRSVFRMPRGAVRRRAYARCGARVHHPLRAASRVCHRTAASSPRVGGRRTAAPSERPCGWVSHG